MNLQTFLLGLGAEVSLPLWEVSLHQEGDNLLILTLSKPGLETFRAFFNPEFTPSNIHGEWVVVGREGGSNLPRGAKAFLEGVFTEPEPLPETEGEYSYPSSMAEGELVVLREDGDLIYTEEGQKILQMGGYNRYII